MLMLVEVIAPVGVYVNGQDGSKCQSMTNVSRHLWLCQCPPANARFGLLCSSLQFCRILNHYSNYYVFGCAIQRFPEAEFHMVGDAGHSAREESITHHLLQATDKYKTL